MKFTTHLTLHSQATRLSGDTSCRRTNRVMDGILTLYDTLFQGICTRGTAEVNPLDHNSGHTGVRAQIFGLSSSLFIRHY